jgi:hypothetical protein
MIAPPRRNLVMPVAASARRIIRVRYRSFDLVGALPDVRGTIVETGAVAGRLLASLEVPVIEPIWILWLQP